MERVSVAVAKEVDPLGHEDVAVGVEEGRQPRPHEAGGDDLQVHAQAAGDGRVRGQVVQGVGAPGVVEGDGDGGGAGGRGLRRGSRGGRCVFLFAERQLIARSRSQSAKRQQATQTQRRNPVSE